MAYQESKQMNEDKLCLTGALAKDYMRCPIGETVKLTVTAILKSACLDSAESVEDDETPCVEFEVLDVDGDKKPYAEMSNGEIEAEIHNVKHEDQAEPEAGPTVSTVPNREDGGSVWTDMKRQEKVMRKPTGRIRPFGYR